MEEDWTKHLYQFDLILVRHAESYNNTIYQAIRDELGDCSEEVFMQEDFKRRQSDSTLSDRGFKQVEKQRAFLANNGWGNVVKDKSRWMALSSPMKRCLLTADAVHNGLGIPVRVDPEMYEDGGCYDASGKGLPGIAKAEVEQLYPGYTCLEGMETGFYAKHERMETQDEFDERIYQIAERLWKYFIDSVEQQRRGETKFIQGVIIVAHGNVLSAVINCLLTQSKTPRVGLFIHENSGYSHVELHYDAMRKRKAIALKQLNEYQHLADDVDLLTRENCMRCGNHTVKDHWIQEFL